MLTQKDIARALGLSAATVTNILSGKPGLRYSEATRQRVLQTAAELGYQPNRSWQTVRRGRSNLIGIITVGVHQEITRKAASRLPLEINASGYDYMVVDLHWHGGSIERVLDELIKSRVEGVVISFMMETFGKPYIERLRRAGIPVVAVDGDERLGLPVVWNDIQAAFLTLTQHLLEIGHRRLVMVAGTSCEARPVRDRVKGFQSALAGSGSCLTVTDSEFASHWERLSRTPASEPSGLVVHLDYARHGHDPTKALYAFSRKLFAGTDLPDALLCSNDAAAFGVFGAALEMGIRIPGDMALTGADNDAYGAMPAFGLTTVNLDIEAACREAVALLVNGIRSGQYDHPGKVLATEPVFRTSCGRSPLPRPALPSAASCKPA
ncbi:MAG TPA: LacI family DNA-binding transcriptional regulator [Chthoniobacteraceae bacterium]|nr:LacI family DNA-binding transcriptional regulator [Chthoniobacteraceae bacterium]